MRRERGKKVGLYRKAGRLKRAIATLGLCCAAAVGAGSPAAAAPFCQLNVTPPVLVQVSGFAGVIDPTCQHVYLTNSSKNRVEVFSLPGGTLESPIPVGAF